MLNTTHFDKKLSTYIPIMWWVVGFERECYLPPKLHAPEIPRKKHPEKVPKINYVILELGGKSKQIPKSSLGTVTTRRLMIHRPKDPVWVSCLWPRCKKQMDFVQFALHKLPEASLQHIACQAQSQPTRKKGSKQPTNLLLTSQPTD